MKKRLIFDVDGTLIRGVTFKSCVENILMELSLYSEENAQRLMSAFGSYEMHYRSYNRSNYLKFLSHILEISLDETFIDLLFSKLKYVVPPYSESLYQTISYLYSKYELVSLTNYFEDSQRNRLEQLGINHFFKECYGEHLIKPNPEAYFLACGACKPYECIMIGDNLELDVIVPMELGFQAIWITEADVLTKGVVKVKSIEDLAKII